MVRLAAASEERFTRIKAHKSFPNHAINFVLSEANIKLEQIDKIAMHEEPIVCTAEHALANLEKDVIYILIFNEELIVWKNDNHKEMEYLND